MHPQLVTMVNEQHRAELLDAANRWRLARPAKRNSRRFFNRHVSDGPAPSVSDSIVEYRFPVDATHKASPNAA